MTDHVFVTGLALHAYHGVMQHEAKVDRPSGSISCSISTSRKPRAPTSSRTPWAMIRSSTSASRAFCGRRYRLVEAAAGAVADAVLERFPQVSACG